MSFAEWRPFCLGLSVFIETAVHVATTGMDKKCDN